TGWQSAGVFGAAGQRAADGSPSAARRRNGSTSNGSQDFHRISRARRAGARAIHHAKGRIMKIEGAVVFITG
ncbi:hypothetical protein, partial [Escherichia coli]|uniref:hypothetical protein n=1 Tax=Escherichia coli TaxID=562 RepID=UPI0019D68089